MDVVVVDYGAGNLRSVVKALEHVGVRPEITGDATALRQADAAVLPGVGAAADTMDSLRRLGLVEPVRAFIASGRPFFGICMGMQVLFSMSAEGGEHPCLGVVPGSVQRLPGGLKVPHMGWNQVRQTVAHPLFDGIPDATNFYFVHSYYAAPDDPLVVAGTTTYGVPFASAIVRGNLVATQFHPEKSGDVGLQMYANFVALARVVA